MFRSLYHYTPALNWMNDPNGLFKAVDGTYHMFYQYMDFPGRLNWGHATSKNLAQWDEQPIAIHADKTNNIFSGSAIVDTMNSTGF